MKKKKSLKKKKPDEPAITSVMPVDATYKEKSAFLKAQISELKQQKKCFDKMIRAREKAIKHYNMMEVMSKITPSTLFHRTSLLPKPHFMAGVVGDGPSIFKIPKKKPKKKRRRRSN